MADNVIETGRSRIEDILLRASNGEALSRIEEILLSLYQDLVHLDDHGLIPTEYIPPQVFERMVTVANDTERFALTTDDVQNGDWVYVNSTQIMYFVSDEDHLDTEAGYTPVAAGIAAKAVADKDGNQIDTTYQPKIDSDHKLSADNVDDSNTTNKFTNATEKQTWNGKQDALTFDSAPTENSTNPVTSGGVYTALSNKGVTFVEMSGYVPSTNTIQGSVPETFTDSDGTFIVAQFTVHIDSSPSYVPANVKIRLHYRTTTFDTTDLYYNSNKIQDNVIKRNEYCLLLRKKFPAIDGYYLIAKSSSIDDIIDIISRLSTVENNILSEQAKTTGMSEGGTNYITVNGIRVYVSKTPPTGARTDDLWIGG